MKWGMQIQLHAILATFYNMYKTLGSILWYAGSHTIAVDTLDKDF